MPYRKKKIFSVVAILLIVFFGGCSFQNSPDKVVKDYCVEILKNGKVYDKMLEDFYSQNRMSRDFTLTNSQIRHLTVACIERMKKCYIQTEIVSSDSNESKVKVTVECVNLNSLDKYVNLKDEVERRVKNINDMEQLESVAVDVLIEFIPQMPIEGVRSFTVECIYDQKQRIWKLKYPDVVLNAFISNVMQGAHL